MGNLFQMWCMKSCKNSLFSIYYIDFLSYKGHQSDFEVIPSERPIKLPCQERGCKCKCFNYVPTNGSQCIRCTCKHTTTDHSVVGSKKCLKPSCGCKKFYSHFTCSCSGPCYNHRVSKHRQIYIVILIWFYSDGFQK